MSFPTKYKCLENNIFEKDNYSIVPIRFEDRLNIMKWRNEQIYHLRQVELLTEKDQEDYFNNIVSKLFFEEKPKQILFSYLENGNCIGYGGLVHINRAAQNAEISFIMNTELEKEKFHFHWSNYLKLIEEVAFVQLKLQSIFTYAYDLRPHLYTMLEANGYKLKERLSRQIVVDGKGVDVLIHKKDNYFNQVSLRKIKKSDLYLIFNWNNDTYVREQSFSSNKITIEEHTAWFEKKLQDENALYFVLMTDNKDFGLIRFDILDGYTLIGILIDADFRGKGLAGKSLNLALKKYFENNDLPILAYIKKTNLKSVNSFKKASFVYSGEELVKDVPSFVYKLEKYDFKK